MFMPWDLKWLTWGSSNKATEPPKPAPAPDDEEHPELLLVLQFSSEPPANQVIVNVAELFDEVPWRERPSYTSLYRETHAWLLRKDARRCAGAETKHLLYWGIVKVIQHKRTDGTVVMFLESTSKSHTCNHTCYSHHWIMEGGRTIKVDAH